MRSARPTWIAGIALIACANIASGAPAEVKDFLLGTLSKSSEDQNIAQVPTDERAEEYKEATEHSLGERNREVAEFQNPGLAGHRLSRLEQRMF